MKKIYGALIGGGLLLVSAMPALANDDVNRCANGLTGPFSRTRCNINSSQNAAVITSQRAIVVNSARLRLNTGNDASVLNTIAKGDSTGGIEAGVKLDTDANNAKVNVVQVDNDSGVSGKNFLTGPFSRASVNINDSQNAAVITNQQAIVVNSANISANTGNNRCILNTICKISTGDVEAKVKIENDVNNSKTNVTQM